MCIRQFGRTLSMIAAVIGGVALAAIFYYVEGDLSVLGWIGLGLSALLLVTLLVVSAAQSRAPLVTGLREGGSFLLICLVGALLSSTVLVALAGAIETPVTTLPGMLLLFLVGFCLTGLLAGLLFLLLDGGDRPAPGVTAQPTIPTTITCR